MCSSDLPHDSRLADVDRLCELNVIEQVVNVSQTTVVRDAWGRGQPLAVHGWRKSRSAARERSHWARAAATDGISLTSATGTSHQLS